MKYVAYMHNNFHHKYNLINKLSQIQYDNFIKLFLINKQQAIFILYKKLNNILNYSFKNEFSEKELLKFNMILNVLPFDDAIKLFMKVNTNFINTNNATKLLKYIMDENKFINMNIGWGPGNHKDVSTNIKEHYFKHVLSDVEKEKWNLLGINNYETYKNYAISKFYEMKNIIVHTDGNKVYMSGFYGNVFIIGRYHDDTFGISSCYYVESGRKLGREHNACFRIFFH